MAGALLIGGAMLSGAAIAGVSVDINLGAPGVCTASAATGAVTSGIAIRDMAGGTVAVRATGGHHGGWH